MENHPSDLQLEYWLHNKDNLSNAEKRQISEHLETCLMCAERKDLLTIYLEELEKELSKLPTVKDQTIAAKILESRNTDLIPSPSLLKTYEAPLEIFRETLPSTFVGYILRYPIQSATTVAIASTIFLVLFLTKPWIDKNPVYVKVENNEVQVFNKKGKTLWNMPANGIPEGVSSKDRGPKSGEKKYMDVVDIDGDGLNEVLLSGDGVVQGTFRTDTLYCFNGKGKLKWKQGTPRHPPIMEIKNANFGWWKIMETYSFNFSNQEKPRLFVMAKAERWSPSVFYEIEPATGEILQSYWHTGNLITTAIFKRPGEKTEEIFLGAINDFYDRGALVVLNPDSIGGISSGQGIYASGGAPNAKEKAYMLFKPSILSELYNSAPYNQIPEIIPANNGNLVVRALEILDRLGINRTASIYYILDKDFNVLHVYGGDNFIKKYSELYEEGKVEIPQTDRYWKQVRDSVLYWDGAQFVNELVRVK